MHYKYKITTPSENDMKQWVGAIQGAIEQANHEIEKHYVVAEKNSSEILSVRLAKNLIFSFQD